MQGLNALISVSSLSLNELKVKFTPPVKSFNAYDIMAGKEGQITSQEYIHTTYFIEGALMALQKRKTIWGLRRPNTEELISL